METVLEKQALANDGSCRTVYSMEFKVVAWGLEVTCTGTMIVVEFNLPPMRTPVTILSLAVVSLC